MMAFADSVGVVGLMGSVSVACVSCSGSVIMLERDPPVSGASSGCSSGFVTCVMFRLFHLFPELAVVTLFTVCSVCGVADCGSC